MTMSEMISQSEGLAESITKSHDIVGKRQKKKRYTQRAKQGVLRKRVLLPPGLKVTLSDPQLNFTQPVVQKEGKRKREMEKSKRQ